MKNTDCYFYFEHYDMGAHISCCTFKEYPLGKCPCDDCTNYVPQSKVSQIVMEYLEYKVIQSAELYKGMTNGEVLCTMFPSLHYTLSDNGRIVTTIGVASSFDKEWWDSPYEPQESEG